MAPRFLSGARLCSFKCPRGRAIFFSNASPVRRFHARPRALSTSAEYDCRIRHRLPLDSPGLGAKGESAASIIRGSADDHRRGGSLFRRLRLASRRARSARLATLSVVHAIGCRQNLRMPGIPSIKIVDRAATSRRQLIDFGREALMDLLRSRHVARAKAEIVADAVLPKGIIVLGRLRMRDGRHQKSNGDRREGERADNPHGNLFARPG